MGILFVSVVFSLQPAAYVLSRVASGTVLYETAVITHISGSHRSSASNPDRPGLANRSAATSRSSQTTAACSAVLVRKRRRPGGLCCAGSAMMPAQGSMMRTGTCFEEHEVLEGGAVNNMVCSFREHGFARTPETVLSSTESENDELMDTSY